MITYRIQYDKREVVDDDNFPLEFLSQAAAEFVVKKLMKLPEYDVPQYWKIISSEGKITRIFMERIIELRLMEDFKKVNSVFDCPIVYKGTSDNSSKYAEELGYRWKRMKGMLFEGFFVHPQTGHCLIPT